MALTVRSDRPEVREKLLNGIDRVARNTALAHGVPEDRLPVVTRSATETTPPTLNDSATVARVREAIGSAIGADRLIETPRNGMGAEDFAYFVAPETGVKGVYFSVGGTPPAEVATAPGHHSPLFRIQPEPSVTTGVEAMVVAAEALFASR
jgi:hippurate hydrolase